ncbi:MAG: T9SS type A sorting domain-containing protein [Flavobacteriales bacterium]|nr:T9SS type A sorting domain-containing protein [Flavobacteriales bacterium]MCB9197456.1 T9SS type A sorting domain-containing protein [Flavobacteriales bacterium]
MLIQRSFTLVLFLGLFNTLLGQYNIGHYQVTFQDPDRSNRNIQTEIYYPATTAGESTPAANGQFPVIVFGHGFVMAWDAYQNLWEEFVPRGYIMVFPRTEGNAFSTDHQEFGWDLQFLVNQIQVEGTTSGKPIYQIVHNNTALMGHSMGGGASFLAADSLCNNGNTQLKTLVGLAPAESSSNGVSSIASATEITVPAVIFSGSQDGVTPPVDHHIPMYNNLASNCKTFVSVTGGGHCYFANSNFNCDFGEATSSSGISIDRDEQHDITYSFLNNWLDYTLKGDCDAFDLFQDSISMSDRVTTNQTCATNAVSTITESSGTLSSSITGTGYQWFLNGNLINGANSSTYDATVAGNYTVEVSFSTGCPTTSAPYSYTPSSTSGIEMINAEKLNIYPNPTNGTIHFGTVNQERIELYDHTGKLIDVFYNTQLIEMHDLTNGIYFARIAGINYKIVKV